MSTHSIDTPERAAVVPRHLSVEEYRRALHWAWHQDPEGVRIYDEPTSASPGPAGTGLDQTIANPCPGAGAIDSGAWSPAQTITVTGLHGGAGASTVAMGLADAAARRGTVVLVDPALPEVSGLACVATTELGVEQGWRYGQRGDALTVERRDSTTLAAARPHPDALIVLDAGVQDLGRWELEARTDGYRVLVAAYSPGQLLRLDTVLATNPGGVAVVTRCPKVTRRWRSTLPPAVTRALDRQQLVCVPHLNDLDNSPLGPQLLPGAVLTAMRMVLDRLP